MCPQDTTSFGEANIICGVSHNFIVRLRTQMNDVALRANEVLRNEVLALLEMMLRLRRKRTLLRREGDAKSEITLQPAGFVI